MPGGKGAESENLGSGVYQQGILITNVLYATSINTCLSTSQSHNWVKFSSTTGRNDTEE